jgi:hypothetical protein
MMQVAKMIIDARYTRMPTLQIACTTASLGILSLITTHHPSNSSLLPYAK